MPLAGNLVLAALSVGGLTWFLAWWGLRRGYLSGVDSLEEFDQQRKRKRKQAKADRRAAKKARRNGGSEPLAAESGAATEPADEPSRRPTDPLHSKWMSFGGGFYGVVALLTWVVAEFSDVFAFLGRLDDLVLRLQVDVLVQLFVNSLMNFIVAITWPVFWIDRLPEPWLVIVAAYAGYWLGAWLAFRYRPDREPDQP